jgi:hypothetical protein
VGLEGLSTEYEQLVATRRDVIELGESRVNFFAAATGAVTIALAALWPRADLGDERFAVISVILATLLVIGEILLGRLLDRAGRIIDLETRINAVRSAMVAAGQLPEEVAKPFREERRWPVRKGGSLPLTVAAITGGVASVAAIAALSYVVPDVLTLTIAGLAFLSVWLLLHLALIRRYVSSHWAAAEAAVAAQGSGVAALGAAGEEKAEAAAGLPARRRPRRRATPEVSSDAAGPAKAQSR